MGSLVAPRDWHINPNLRRQRRVGPQSLITTGLWGCLVNRSYQRRLSLVFVATIKAHWTAPTLRLSCFAKIAAVEDQPMVAVGQKSCRDALFQGKFNSQRCFAERKARSIGYPKNMRVDGDPGLPQYICSTTLAVLRPTPGSASSASRSRGTLPS